MHSNGIWFYRKPRDSTARGKRKLILLSLCDSLLLLWERRILKLQAPGHSHSHRVRLHHAKGSQALGTILLKKECWWHSTAQVGSWMNPTRVTSVFRVLPAWEGKPSFSSHEGLILENKHPVTQIFTEGGKKRVQGNQATFFINKKPTQLNCRTQLTKSLPAPGSLGRQESKMWWNYYLKKK